MLRISNDVDITEIKVDVIVNSANKKLKCGGGVCGAIFKKAGKKALQLACKAFSTPIKAGSAVITEGFNLPAKYIIHAVSTPYKDGSQGEIEILKNCYKNSLLLAEEKNCNSIAFPLIGGGIYGYPKKTAINTAVSTITEFIETHLKEDLDVILILDDESFEIAKNIEVV